MENHRKSSKFVLLFPAFRFDRCNARLWLLSCRSSIRGHSFIPAYLPPHSPTYLHTQRRLQPLHLQWHSLIRARYYRPTWHRLAMRRFYCSNTYHSYHACQHPQLLLSLLHVLLPLPLCTRDPKPSTINASTKSSSFAVLHNRHTASRSTSSCPTHPNCQPPRHSVHTTTAGCQHSMRCQKN
jgi:hypothetical protein